MKNRNYGIDLLRILSMYMVVILHIMGHGGILDNLKVLSLKFNISWFLEICCYCAVNCYGLVTGYVMLNSKFSYKKIFNLWLDVLFWRVLLTIILNFLYPDMVGKKDIFMSIFNITYNSYWYFSAYFALFFFIPYINKLIKVLDKKLFKRLIVTIILLMSFIGIFSNSFSLNGGYSFVWLMALYFIGAYIKKYDIGIGRNKLYMLIVMMLLILLTYISKLFFLKYSNLTFGLFNSDILVNYTSFTILGVAVLMLLIFLNLKINNKYLKRFIRRIAPVTFFVYVIHEHSIVKKLFIIDSFYYITFSEWYMIVPMVLLYAFIIFMICSYMEMIRRYIFKKFKIYKIVEFSYSIFSGSIKKIERMNE